jgi:tetratricopeptide (TPR) repeat protein
MHRYFFTGILWTLCLFAQAQNPAEEAARWKATETEADTLMSREDFKGAIKLYTKIMDATGLKERADYRILYKRSIGYYSMGEFNQAINDISRFISQVPESFQARVLRALCYRELGDTEKQLMDVEKALELSSGDVQILKWRASLLLELNKFKEAIADFLLVRQLNDDPEVEMNLAFAYFSNHQPDSALIAINKAIELEATFLPPYLYGGSFCLQEGENELALKYLNVALRLDPDNATAWFYKGIALIELKREEEACRCLNKAFYAGQDDAGEYLKQYCFGSDD